MKEQVMEPKERPLTTQQKRFAVEYIKCLDVKSAAVRAGYKPVNAALNGAMLLRKPQLVRELNERLRENVQSLRVSRSYVVKKLLEIIEFSLAEEEILDKDGGKTGKKKLRDAGAGLRALESLCKHLGLAAEDVTQQGEAHNAESQEPCVVIVENLSKDKL